MVVILNLTHNIFKEGLYIYTHSYKNGKPGAGSLPMS